MVWERGGERNGVGRVVQVREWNRVGCVRSRGEREALELANE